MFESRQGYIRFTGPIDYQKFEFQINWNLPAYQKSPPFFALLTQIYSAFKFFR